MPGRPTVAAAFLDHRPLDETDASIRGLHDIFIRAYGRLDDALAIAGQVGLIAADIEIHLKLRLTWWSILREAADESVLRRLVDQALLDPTIGAWHAKMRQILAVPVGPVTVPSGAAAKPGQREDGEEAETGARSESGVGSQARLWTPGTVLRVRFLSGDPRLQARVRRAATRWLDVVNLKMEFGTDPDAQIRVDFDSALGSWSYLGTDALTIPKGERTINLGWLDATTDAETLDRTVMHEFGHVLGLMHEHQNPTSTLKWDRPAVYKSLGGPPNHWTRQMVDEQIFKIWPPRYFPFPKVFDRASIMMFPQPAEYFRDDQAVDWNPTLSPLDLQFAAALYPGRSGR